MRLCRVSKSFTRNGVSLRTSGVGFRGAVGLGVAHQHSSGHISIRISYTSKELPLRHLQNSGHVTVVNLHRAARAEGALGAASTTWTSSEAITRCALPKQIHPPPMKFRRSRSFYCTLLRTCIILRSSHNVQQAAARQVPFEESRMKRGWPSEVRQADGGFLHADSLSEQKKVRTTLLGEQGIARRVQWATKRFASMRITQESYCTAIRTQAAPSTPKQLKQTCHHPCLTLHRGTYTTSKSLPACLALSYACVQNTPGGGQT